MLSASRVWSRARGPFSETLQKGLNTVFLGATISVGSRGWSGHLLAEDSLRRQDGLSYPGGSSPSSLGGESAFPEGKHTSSLYRPPAPEGPYEAGHLQVGCLSPWEGFVSGLYEDLQHFPCCGSCSHLFLHGPSASGSPAHSNPGRATGTLENLPGHTALHL